MSASKPNHHHSPPLTTVPTTTNNKHKKPHYGQRAVWRCQNKLSGRIHTIHGPLAEILNRYPSDYALDFLGTERPSNRWFG